MPNTLSPDQRQALTAQAEGIIDVNDLHGQTAWAYGNVDVHRSLSVIVCCADGSCYLEVDGCSPTHWVEAEDGRAADATLRDLQQDEAWSLLFTQNGGAV